MYRRLYTSSEAPSDDVLDEYDSPDRIASSLLDSSREQRVKRAKARRKSSKSEGNKERQVSISSIQSMDSIEDEMIPSPLVTAKPPVIEWSKVFRSREIIVIHRYIKKNICRWAK